MKDKKETEEKKIEQAKKISIREANAYSFMDGFGLRYITPFALAIGANNKHIGLLSSIPSLFGNLSQLYTLKAMDKYSRKKIVFLGVLLQAIMWLFLIGVGSLYFLLNLKNEAPPYLLILVYTLLCLFGAFAGPAWASWMKDLVVKERGEYFGRRSRIAGFVSLACLLIAGFVLDYFKQTKIFIGFAILFFVAFLGRSISAVLTTKQYEPKFKSRKKAYFSIFQFIKKMKDNNFGRFVLYFALVSLTTSIASPFFAVYMLKNLNFTYIQFMIITFSGSLSSLVFMPFWGKFSDKYGNIKTMKLLGLFTPFIPFLWMASAFIFNSTNSAIVIYLVIIEAFSGLIWAGFNLAAGNFIYDAVTRERLAICASYFNILNGFGVVIGSVIGGFIASSNSLVFGLAPLLFVMLISGVARFIVYIVMSPKIQEVRIVKRFTKKEAEEKIKNLSFHKFLEYFEISLPKIKIT